MLWSQAKPTPGQLTPSVERSWQRGSIAQLKNIASDAQHWTRTWSHRNVVFNITELVLGLRETSRRQMKTLDTPTIIFSTHAKPLDGCTTQALSNTHERCRIKASKHSRLFLFGIWIAGWLVLASLSAHSWNVLHPFAAPPAILSSYNSTEWKKVCKKFSDFFFRTFLSSFRAPSTHQRDGHFTKMVSAWPKF